ncbi:hypothetical protein [Kitasatospora sp. NBC_00070]|uniref:hypothetical protein n=1 Tax=Kitasatospora sp. NBC_00070 TaxID=2975962 RepID=UPI0038602756
MPLLSCGKIPVTDRSTSSILAIRTGEDNEGMIGLYRSGLPPRPARESAPGPGKPTFGGRNVSCTTAGR